MLTYADIELRLGNLVDFDIDSDEGGCDGEQRCGASLVHHALNVLSVQASLSSSESRRFKCFSY